MAAVRSNLDQVLRGLNGLSGCLNFRRPLRGGRRLGDEIADVIAAGIVARTLDDQKGSDGGPLKANRGRYGRRKRSRGLAVGVGLRGDQVGGEMLGAEAVRGQVAIGQDYLVLTAGRDAEEQAKIDYFSSGNPANDQPARDFIGLDNRIVGGIDDACDEAVDDAIKALGG